MLDEQLSKEENLPKNKKKKISKNKFMFPTKLNLIKKFFFYTETNIPSNDKGVSVSSLANAISELSTALFSHVDPLPPLALPRQETQCAFYNFRTKIFHFQLDDSKK